ncbi:hypothetical protein Psfp_04222 [Pelotomaculum sp. FP]|nr:hypothetical protein Psfp_04222 [Pelotomaculum sp. FP]
MYLEAKIRNFISVAFFVIQFGIIFALISTRKLDYIRDVIFITIIAAVYIFLEVKYSISVSNYIRVCLVLVILVHEVGGKIYELYLQSIKPLN